MISLRIAQVSITLFALGHTLGMLNTAFRDDGERNLMQALAAYRFDIMGVQRSHQDFYQGMGWSLSLFLVFCLLLTQWLIPIMHSAPSQARPILYGLAATFAVMTAFCVRWFFPAPLLMSAVAALALAYTAYALRPA